MMTKSPPPFRIVIVAQNASTEFGGEAILPVHYFRILRDRGADVHLIGHARNRENLREYFAGDLRNVQFVTDTRLHMLLHRLDVASPLSAGHFIASNAMNLWTEVLQRRCVRALVRDVPRTVIHIPTPVSPRAVSLVVGVGAPTVYGPMNGGMSFPPGYGGDPRSSRQRALRLARAAARFANVLLPGKRRAARLLVANDRTATALPLPHDGRVLKLVENGVQLDLWRPPERAPTPPGSTFRLVFVGRLIGWKAIDVTLRAVEAARASGSDVTLDVVGSGSERGRLESLRDELGLADAVTFHGFLPQARTARLMADCDALILNSLYECGGAVVLEAMAMGLPVIASAWGGPLDYLDASTGILVDPVPRASFTGRLADAIGRLATDPGLARRMGTAGRARVVSEFDWEKKVDRIVEIFADVASAPR